MKIHKKKISIKGISLVDIEHLRIWKNRYKEYFFHKEHISHEEQLYWFNNTYLKSKDTIIYKISYEEELVGCMGVYFRKDYIEIYNVILGNDKFKSSGLMSFLLEYICKKYNFNVFVKVLNINPALGWYRKNGFHDLEKNNEYTTLKLEIPSV